MVVEIVVEIGGGGFQWWVCGFVADYDGGDRWDLEEGSFREW